MIMFPLILFLLILVILYIYISHQFKKSQELRIYETDYKTNENLQEICDIRQPFLFPLSLELFHGEFLETIEKAAMTDVNIKRVSSQDSAPVSMECAKHLVMLDDDNQYFSEKNGEFLEFSGLNSNLDTFDNLLRPTFTVHRERDLLFGSVNTFTPLLYHQYYRRFIWIASGSVRIKMTPWRSSRFLSDDGSNDQSDVFEIRSPINMNHVQPEFLSRFRKVQFLEFDVSAGNVVFIPPYWWYSIQYLEANNDQNISTVVSTSYMTFMNTIANLPGIINQRIEIVRDKISIDSTVSSLMAEPIKKSDDIIDNQTEYPVKDKEEMRKMVEIINKTSDFDKEIEELKINIHPGINTFIPEKDI